MNVQLSETTDFPTVRLFGSVWLCSAVNRKSGVDFLLDKPMNFYLSLFGLVFGSVRYRPDTRPEVDVQMFCWSVVVVQARRRCSVVVVVLLYYPELPGLCSTRSARHASAMTTEGLSSIYTISGGRGLGLRPRTAVGADRAMGEACRSSYRGKTGPNRFLWRRWAALEVSRTVGS